MDAKIKSWHDGAGCMDMNLPQYIAFGLVAFVTIFSLANVARAQSRSNLKTEFSDLFIELECGLSHPSYRAPYEDCASAPAKMMDFMDWAMRLRTTCPHPLNYSVFVQMAFDCSARIRDLSGGSADDVSACFSEEFVKKHSPASEHYCAIVERGNPS